MLPVHLDDDDDDDVDLVQGVYEDSKRGTLKDFVTN